MLEFLKEQTKVMDLLILEMTDGNIEEILEIVRLIKDIEKHQVIF